MKYNKRTILILSLFFVFLFIRIFDSSSEVLISSDSLKFLEAANNFPKHTLYNDQLYLLHPPGYPYAIYFFKLIFQDSFVAGVMLSLASASLSFFVLYRLIMLLTGNFRLAFYILLLYTLSINFIFPAKGILREFLFVLLTLTTLYFYIKGIKEYNWKSIILATVFGMLLAFTANFVIFIFPAFAFAYFIFNKDKPNLFKWHLPKLWFALIPVVFTLFVFSGWTLIKFQHYTADEFYPNGYEGAPLNTENINLLEVFSPQQFEDFEGSYHQKGLIAITKKLAFYSGYMFNLEPFDIPRGLNFTTMTFLLKPIHIFYMVVIYFPLALFSLFSLYHFSKNTFKKKQIHGNVELFMVGIFIVYLYPITAKFSSPRYLMISYIAFFFVIASGMLLAEKRLSQKTAERLPYAIVILLALLFVPFWFITNPFLVFAKDMVLSPENTGRYIVENLPEGSGIMVQPGYAIKLDYITDYRILGLDPNPDRLPEVIEFFDIDYIITSRYFTQDERFLSVRSVQHVFDNPDQFEFVTTVNEDFTRFYEEENKRRTDELSIYKIIRN